MRVEAKVNKADYASPRFSAVDRRLIRLSWCCRCHGRGCCVQHDEINKFQRRTSPVPGNTCKPTEAAVAEPTLAYRKRTAPEAVASLDHAQIFRHGGFVAH